MPKPDPVRGFLRYLMDQSTRRHQAWLDRLERERRQPVDDERDRYAILTQVAIAERADVSQSWVHKRLFQGGIRREPDPNTYRKLAEAFPEEWRQYLAESPDVAADLRKAYSFALVASVADASPDDVAEALPYLRALFRSPSHRAIVLEQLRVQAQLVAATPSPESPASIDEPAPRGRRPLQRSRRQAS